MIDFKSLDPEIRAYTLIGQFLKRWSNLEQQIHEAIGAALGLDETRRYILCANLQLKDKLHMLRTLVQQSSIPPEVKESTNTELAAILNYTHRNMIAHDAFEPAQDEDGDGVVFFPVKAKKEFSRPRDKWSVNRFQEEGKTIATLAENVTRLKERFSDATTFDFPILGTMEAMEGSDMTILRTTPLALHDSLSHPVPKHPHCDPPNQEKSDQTPESPRESNK